MSDIGHAWAPEADTWFRTMDLTESVTFTLAMAKASLDTHMRQEVEFLEARLSEARF
jgi:hypothetical protein